MPTTFCDDCGETYDRALGRAAKRSNVSFDHADWFRIKDGLWQSLSECPDPECLEHRRLVFTQPAVEVASNMVPVVTDPSEASDMLRIVFENVKALKAAVEEVKSDLETLKRQNMEMKDERQVYVSHFKQLRQDRS